MRARSGLVVILAIVAARAVTACVDGVTPDCSNPSVCAPTEGDAAITSSDSSTVEAATKVDTGADVVTQPVLDASADADAHDG